MLTSFYKGLQRVSAYYAGGVVLILIFHVLTYSDYPYAPPKSIVALAILLVCSLPWVALNVTGIFNSSSRQQVLGELTVHFIVYGLSLSGIIYYLNH